MTAHRDRTGFSELTGCALPIQLAPIGNVGLSLELQLAVAHAGGYPVYPAVQVPADELDAALGAIARETPIFGANFIAPLLEPEALQAAAERAQLVDFFYGDPDAELVRVVHAGDALASWQVGSCEEAIAAVEAGCDLIVAQGIEAGGRIRGRLPLQELLEQVTAAVDVPVLAAGGIATASDVGRAIAAGASGVRVGTRFVASEEANAHPEYKSALVDAEGDEAVVTRAFARGAPDFPHRVLKRSLDGARAFEGELVGGCHGPNGYEPMPVYSALVAGRDFEGAVEATPFYAGRSVGSVEAVQPAAEIVADLAGGLPLANDGDPVAGADRGAL